MPSLIRPRTVASSPQSTGEGMPAGGGTRAAVALNICPMKPVGTQLAMTMRPPARQTRISSFAASSGRGANIAPNIVTAVSKAPSS